MRKFEYRYCTLVSTNIEERLNNFGAEGWELVNSEMTDNTPMVSTKGFYAILKREIVEVAPPIQAPEPETIDPKLAVVLRRLEELKDSVSIEKAKNNAINSNLWNFFTVGYLQTASTKGVLSVAFSWGNSTEGWGYWKNVSMTL